MMHARKFLSGANRVFKFLRRCTPLYIIHNKKGYEKWDIARKEMLMKYLAERASRAEGRSASGPNIRGFRGHSGSRIKGG